LADEKSFLEKVVKIFPDCEIFLKEEEIWNRGMHHWLRGMDLWWWRGTSSSYSGDFNERFTNTGSKTMCTL